MIIFPAIDIKDGKVVRLLQGNFDEVTEYSGDPAVVARKWQEKGAKWIHVVDLDGAKTGQLQNYDVIVNIANSVDIPIQVGGGIRQEKDVQRLMRAGVARVIVGTKAIEDKEFLQDILAMAEGKIAVSLDCSKGFLAQRGWVETSDIKATDFVRGLEGLGLACLIYTDIAKDGMLSGPNFEALEELLKMTPIPVIASGGVSSLKDIERLMTMEPRGLLGAIIGKAIYEGKIHLEEAVALCSRKG